MKPQIALFGIHKLLSKTLEVLEKENSFPRVVVFPAIDSEYHDAAEDICQRNGVTMLRPASVKNPSFIRELEELFINRIIVTGFHQIFPASLLALATEGAVNCHGGLLPEEKGPVPWKWAVYENRPFTGVTFHRMTMKVDEGQILVKRKIMLDPDETATSLFDKITDIVAATVPKFFEPQLVQEYNRESASLNGAYRGQVPPELTVFDLSQSAEELHRRVRAFSPRPGVFLKQDNQLILVIKSKIGASIEDDGMIFKTADGNIRITEYQLSDHG